MLIKVGQFFLNRVMQGGQVFENMTKS